MGSPLSLQYLGKILYGGHLVGISGVDHLWFLPCFFLSVIIFNLLYTWLKQKHWIFLLLAIVICALISSYLNYNNAIVINIGEKTFHLTGYAEVSKTDFYIGFPYFFNAALTGVVLMYIGYVLRFIYDKYDILFNKLRSIVIGIISLALGTICFVINSNFLDNDFPFHLVTPSYAIYGNYLLFLFTSTFLTLFVISVATIIDNKYMAKYGRETMTVYALHPFLLGIIGNLGLPSIKGLVPSLLALLLSCLFIPLIKKIDPVLLGQKIK